MNVDEARVLIAEGATLEVITAPVDLDHLDEMARGWAEVCTAVPFEFARRVIIGWDSPYKIRASQVRGTWEQQTRSTPGLYPDSACAWARVCRCTHDGCHHGQLVGTEDRVTVIHAPRGDIERHTDAVRWCPTCWDARNVIRQDHQKEPRQVGDLTP